MHCLECVKPRIKHDKARFDIMTTPYQFKAKKDWIKGLNNIHKVTFLSIQETKMDSISEMDIIAIWGNYRFEYVFSEAVGTSGGILCAWDPCFFRKDHHILSDNFVALYGTWIPKQEKVLLISIYAPQSTTSKRMLWDYISSLVCRWNGLCMVMGDFNEVRRREDRSGSIFNVQGVCLDRHLSDHRPILLRENNIVLDDRNVMIRLKKKLQILKKEIRTWISGYKKNHAGRIDDLQSKLRDIDRIVDSGGANDDILLSRLNILQEVHDIQSSTVREGLQKAKIKWAIEGVMVDGEWVDEPGRVKEEFRSHFASRFQAPTSNRCRLNFTFPKCLDSVQAGELESSVSNEEVRKAVQILDGPFIINEILSWCKYKKQQAMVFKVDFAKAYDSGDPLAPFLFILVMETLHISLVRAIDAGIFKGLNIGTSFTILHLFYADDAINLKKSHLLGVGLPSEVVHDAAENLSCSTMKTPFKYLGVMVGGNCSKVQAWDDTISKVKARLSIWKLKALSVGGRFTLLRSEFFNGVHYDERKIAWVKWSKVLASKNYGGLGVSSFYALNRALLFKWVWRYISGDSSLWCRFIKAMHDITLSKTSKFRFSNWITIVREVFRIKDCVVDLLSHCHLRVGNGLRTKFWKDLWIGDTRLCALFPRIYALETGKDCSVAEKLHSVSPSLRRAVRGGAKASQLDLLQESIQNVILSNMDDRWTWDFNGEGVFRVKDVHFRLDEFFLLKAAIVTRWVKYIPIKVNIFVWKLFLDHLPTRDNLLHRGVLVPNALFPICSFAQEDSSHLFFSCCMVTEVVRLICHWWNIDWSPLGSYADWLSWFNSIRFNSFLKALLDGFFYTAWWSVWIFRNQLLFSSQAPRKDVLFDDIVSRTFLWCHSRCNHLFS
uniref:RNA-directed DNA polymerase, eukaryota n=1 Tax=Tanacetum cinerariifolium TaxID=118510 RepID=A0A6L2MW79_TANCI|nr:RNA-directed DNA polymerase, eukaryota [Tanacetum cinerariifolium]